MRTQSVPYRRGDCIEICDVIVDLVLPILARHPRRANRSLRRWRAVDAPEIEAVQCFGRDDEPRAIIEARQTLDERRRKLTITVENEPELANWRIERAQGLITCGTTN